MSRARKSGPRYPSGRLKYATRDPVCDEVTVTVLRQPHRKGDTDQRRASALGRFVLAYRMRSEIYDSGNEYAELVARWRAARGIPTDVRLGVGGCGEGPADETVREWNKKIEMVHAAITLVAKPGLPLIRTLILDDRDIDATDAIVTQSALSELAYALGRLGRGAHPFV